MVGCVGRLLNLITTLRNSATLSDNIEDFTALARPQNRRLFSRELLKWDLTAISRFEWGQRFGAIVLDGITYRLLRLCWLGLHLRMRFCRNVGLATNVVGHLAIPRRLSWRIFLTFHLWSLPSWSHLVSRVIQTLRAFLCLILGVRSWWSACSLGRHPCIPNRRAPEDLFPIFSQPFVDCYW